jgi:DNA processing protein
MSSAPEVLDLLRLTLTPGLGPVLIGRLVETFGSAAAALGASARELERVRGIGAGKSGAFARAMKESQALAEQELELAARHKVRIIGKDDPRYPPLLAPLYDAPPILYVRGELRPGDMDQYPVAIVGSRRATAYGIEQAERFAGVLGSAGLTIVSGGARGIDTAAHRGALRSGGRTVAMLGCGLAQCYPPENEDLFERMAADGRGAVVSELPMRTAPEADNFPARNRLISGMCLGVIVIEAGRRSGSLITARMAAAEHNREVMAVPGRVDSAASIGTHELLKEGAAALVTDPGDVLGILETPARHAHGGTHRHRYAPADAEQQGGGGLFGDGRESEAELRPGGEGRGLPLSEAQQAILAALAEPRTVDELVRATGLAAAEIRSEVTILEIQRRISRDGSRLARA